MDQLSFIWNQEVQDIIFFSFFPSVDQKFPFDFDKSSAPYQQPI